MVWLLSTFERVALVSMATRLRTKLDTHDYVPSDTSQGSGPLHEEPSEDALDEVSPVHTPRTTTAYTAHTFPGHVFPSPCGHISTLRAMQSLLLSSDRQHAAQYLTPQAVLPPDESQSSHADSRPSTSAREDFSTDEALSRQMQAMLLDLDDAHVDAATSDCSPAQFRAFCLQVVSRVVASYKARMHPADLCWAVKRMLRAFGPPPPPPSSSRDRLFVQLYHDVASALKTVLQSVSKDLKQNRVRGL